MDWPRVRWRGDPIVTSPSTQRADRFQYAGYDVDPSRGEIRCTYTTAGHTFTERYAFGPGGDWREPAVGRAVRLLFLLAGVSYYKTAAAHTIDLGAFPTTESERAFLKRYYTNGLGEFAYRNGLDLDDLSIIGPDVAPAVMAPHTTRPGSPLIPFGGGIDSIVTVNALSAGHPDAALCIVHPPGDRFAAIEDPARVTGLRVVRIERELSPLVRRSAELGFLNGHVPVTAVISAAALVAAVVGGHGAVVLSNEHSASVPTLVHAGRPINHQWSKSLEFEEAFARLVRDSLGHGVTVFSYLRSRSELWVAREFSRLTEFHHAFRSCNRSFHQDPAQRLDHWCGTCDKCCFINLILAPFMKEADLRAVFNGHEPLANADLHDRFLTLLGLGGEERPFECVGDPDESRAAVVMAAERPDRANTALLRTLRALVAQRQPAETTDLFAPAGPHYIPDGYAPPDLLVRAH